MLELHKISIFSLFKLRLDFSMPDDGVGEVRPEVKSYKCVDLKVEISRCKVGVMDRTVYDRCDRWWGVHRQNTTLPQGAEEKECRRGF